MLLLRMHGTRYVVPEGWYQSTSLFDQQRLCDWTDCLRIKQRLYVFPWLILLWIPARVCQQRGQIVCTSLQYNQLFDCIALIRFI